MARIISQDLIAERSLNWPALLETVLLGSTAALLLAKVQSGVLAFYIHPRYTLLVVVSGVVLALAALARMRAIFSWAPEPLRGRRGLYLLLAFPLLLGTLVPARPLGADALLSKGMEAGVLPGAGPALGEDTLRWNLLQWVTALIVDREALSGKPADVVGFVYHDPARPLDGFVAVRYVVTCCAADGNGVGLPVIWPGGAELKPDSWVRVRGTLGRATIAGKAEPALLAEAIEEVPQPKYPYLYP